MCRLLGLLPVLPPVRLPEEAELAAQARRSALLADLRDLADEVRKKTVQTAAVNPALLRLAEEAELVERDDEDLAPGEDVGWLDDLADDSDALDAWEYTFAVVLDTTLEAVSAVLAPRPPSLAVPATDKLLLSRPWCAWLGRQLLRGGF